MGLITLGLCQIKVGTASPSGDMPALMNKIGKTYKDTAKISQDPADVTEYFEEGIASPRFREKNNKIPKIMFSLMNADPRTLADYVGGTVVETNANKTWSYKGDGALNKAILLESEQGLDFEIPNGDIEAIINADMSAKGIFLVDFTVTPMYVDSGIPFRCVYSEAFVVKLYAGGFAHGHPPTSAADVLNLATVEPITSGSPFILSEPDRGDKFIFTAPKGSITICIVCPSRFTPTRIENLDWGYSMDGHFIRHSDMILIDDVDYVVYYYSGLTAFGGSMRLEVTL